MRATPPAVDAGLKCVDLFAEDFREGAGQLTISTGPASAFDLDRGFLRVSLPVGSPVGTRVIAEKEIAVSDPATVRAFRFFQTLRTATWPRGYRVHVGCAVAFPGSSTSIALELAPRPGQFEDEMRLRVVAENGGLESSAVRIEESIAADDRHVLALLVEPTPDGGSPSVDVLWDGVSRGKIRDVALPERSPATLRCGILSVREIPDADVDASTGGAPSISVDDLGLVVCR